MNHKVREGYCNICGNYRQLTFEHIPPKSAFNNKPVIAGKFETILNLGPDERIKKGKIQQRGMGGYVLCSKCNNDTGAWYGNHFIDFCYQSMEILIKAKGKPTLIYLSYIFPLDILKQIVVMFLATDHEGFGANHPELVKFVLNKEKRFLSPKYRFYIYYNIEGNHRFSGTVAKCDASGRRKPIMMSEISFPPFGYVMTIDSESPDERLVEITHYSRYKYNEFKVMTQSLPVLPTHLFFPGDYRKKEEIKKQLEETKKSYPKYFKNK